MFRQPRNCRQIPDKLFLWYFWGSLGLSASAHPRLVFAVGLFWTTDSNHEQCDWSLQIQRSMESAVREGDLQVSVGEGQTRTLALQRI